MDVTPRTVIPKADLVLCPPDMHQGCVCHSIEEHELHTEGAFSLREKASVRFACTSSAVLAFIDCLELEAVKFATILNEMGNEHDAANYTEWFGQQVRGPQKSDQFSTGCAQQRSPSPREEEDVQRPRQEWKRKRVRRLESFHPYQESWKKSWSNQQ